MTYPDNWVVLQIKTDEGNFYKVLAGWSGGYAQGDSWRLNSGVTEVEDIGDHYKFYGYSGSCYTCGKQSYGLRMNNAYVWERIKKDNPDKVVLLEDRVNWTNLLQSDEVIEHDRSNETVREK